MPQEFNFKQWIREQSGAYTFVEEDEDHFRLATDYAVAQINFYAIEGEEEVIEFRIDTTDSDEAKFFLHFHANHREHAIELFEEMVQTLTDLQDQVIKEVLLCCTSGLTTSFFAEKLNQVAQEQNFPYSFSAVSVNDVYEAGVGKVAILLAPQIRYMEKQLKEVMTDSVILNISTKVFGTYDALSCIQEMDQEIQKMKKSKEEQVIEKIHPEMEAKQRVMIISAMIVNTYGHIFYRVYDHGKIELDRVVRKRRITLKDIEDVIDTQVCSCSGTVDVDCIGLAIPGVIHHGVLYLSPTSQTDLVQGHGEGFAIKEYLETKYKVPFSIDNNTNAAALGWYGQQNEDSNIVLYSQPRGWVYGGQGIVIDGKVLHGRLNGAGEIKNIVDQFRLNTPLRYNPYNPEHVFELVTKVILMDISLLDPDVICLRSELTPDMGRLRQELAKYMDATRIPKLVYIDNFNEYIMLGELLYTMNA